MNRRQFLIDVLAAGSGASLGTVLIGCRSHQFAHVLSSDQNDMVGSHAAGAETFTPLVNETVARLLGRCTETIQPVSHSTESLPPGRLAICFIGVENKSIEELGDFKEQIYQLIDTQIVQSEAFHPISRRYVEVGLRETRLRPDELFIPSNMRVFTATMEQMGQPFDYLLYATITSGTTQSNRSYQRDYLLTLEMVDVHSGESKKESAKLRKGYHPSRLGKLTHYNPFK